VNFRPLVYAHWMRAGSAAFTGSGPITGAMRWWLLRSHPIARIWGPAVKDQARIDSQI